MRRNLAHVIQQYVLSALIKQIGYGYAKGDIWHIFRSYNNRRYAMIFWRPKKSAGEASLLFVFLWCITAYRLSCTNPLAMT